MEGKKITKILDIGGQYRALLLDDEEVAIVKMVVDDLSLEELSEFLPGKPDKKESKPKESKKETKKEPEPDDDPYTWEDLVDMDYDDLEELCDENELDVDPADYEDDEVDDFRKAIAKEIEIEVPEDEDSEEEEQEEESDDDEYTWDDLEEMDFEELQDFCDENELELDLDDFTEEEEDKLRREIAKEVGIEPPKAKPKRKSKK